MTIIKIDPYENGGYANQTSDRKIIPEGWAIVACETPNFPFGIPTFETINDIETVVAWEPIDIPTPIEPVLTPKELREKAYETDKIISWDDSMLTVDEAEDLFMKYFAEGKEEVYSVLRDLISAAKDYIREQYPDTIEEEVLNNE